LTNDEQHHDIAKIRELLAAAFKAEDLRRFCLDRLLFRAILRRFGPGHGFDDMIDEVIEYCRMTLLFDELLAEVKRTHSRQYERFFPVKPSGPIPPDTLSISRPIALDLVRVPAGDFWMGSDLSKDADAREDELPRHHVYVPDFYIGKYLVTNAHYLTFVRTTGQSAPALWDKGRVPQGEDNYPVRCVSWDDAVDFCTWLRKETGLPFRLPTETEWEKAARGLNGRIYPWGNDPPDEGRCNYGVELGGHTTVIGRYSPLGDSPYGCGDMAGNVQEWCQSLHRPYPYRADDGRENLEAELDDPRVLRGGGTIAALRESVAPAARRASPTLAMEAPGFESWSWWLPVTADLCPSGLGISDHCFRVITSLHGTGEAGMGQGCLQEGRRGRVY
jgi:formylglycine-generating enzyme required for sulfatase activity